MKIFNYQFNNSYGKVVGDSNGTELVEGIKLSFKLPLIYSNEKDLFCNINLAGYQRNLKLKELDGVRVCDIPEDFLKQGEIKVSIVIIKPNKKTKVVETIKTMPCESIYLYKTKVDNDGLVSVVPELEKIKQDINSLRDALIKMININTKDGIL